MKNYFLLLFIFSIFFLTGCDPVYPPGELRIEKIGELSIGETHEVKFRYPYTGGSIVVGWKEQKIETINGNDIISVSNLSITGVKAGTAVLKISAITIISEEAIIKGLDEKVYSIVLKIKIK